MKSLDATRRVALLSAILEDMGMVSRTSITRDLMTIRERVEHEGLSFLTITLPAFAKAFELALENGRIDPALFPGFKSGHGVMFPAFLQGFIGQVFTSEGVIKDAPDTDSIDCVRQVCLAFKKVEDECTLSRLRAAEKQFVDTEREVSGFRIKRYSQHADYKRVCSYLYGNILGSAGNLLAEFGLVPRHGPGATADKTYGNRKYLNQRWTERLQKTFPYDSYKLFNYNELLDNLSRGAILGDSFIKRHDEPPVRVVFVPKTMKSPRVIAIEPVWTQEVQQGLMRVLVDLMESDELTRGHINFARQDVNRNLALESSKSRAYATIDLSEASDRVHPSLVAGIFHKRDLPLSRAVFACRSESAILPSGAKVRLRKFASQGSALCFPVEAMVFYSIVVTALLRHRNLRLTRRNVKSVARDAYVYGDDIIVPVAEVSTVCEQLEAAGLKVNRGKTFAKGYFRESCGMDAYAGVNVTPVYIRRPLPSTIRDAEEIESAVSTANQFYRKGCWKTAALLRKYTEEVTGVVPHVPDNSPVMGWHSFQQISSFKRWNPDLQRLEIRSLKLRPKSVTDRLDGYRALHKWAVCRNGNVPVIGGDEPLSAEAFVRRVVSGRTRVNFRWAPA